MSLQTDQFYHFYNQGNNGRKIFFTDENYLYFLRSFRKFVYPYCDVVCFCLMPNHFHFLLNTNPTSVKLVKVGSLEVSNLKNGFRNLLSSYAKAINKQQGFKGSLFRQKTKAKLLESDDYQYPFICFHYIHQNPLNACLVEKMEDWPYSSFPDYMGTRNGQLCRKELAYELIGVSKSSFHKESYQVISSDKIDGIFWLQISGGVWHFQMSDTPSQITLIYSSCRIAKSFIGQRLSWQPYPQKLDENNNDKIKFGYLGFKEDFSSNAIDILLLPFLIVYVALFQILTGYVYVADCFREYHWQKNKKW